ncbi:hypothetical protein GCM10011587_30240 [Pyruvatibacter mobilis]|nr:hypothetical protein GCM10011587_30240 [Pyruvatibacter mobilis]
MKIDPKAETKTRSPATCISQSAGPCPARGEKEIGVADGRMVVPPGSADPAPHGKREMQRAHARSLEVTACQTAEHASGNSFKLAQNP